MKTFKLIDCCAQIFLVGCCIIWALAYYPEDEALIAYGVAAGGNLLSCLIHIALKYGQEKTSLRSQYQRNMLIIVAIVAGSWALMDVFLTAFFVIFPITAFIYIRICIKETYSSSKTTGYEQ